MYILKFYNNKSTSSCGVLKLRLWAPYFCVEQKQKSHFNVLHHEEIYLRKWFPQPFCFVQLNSESQI